MSDLLSLCKELVEANNGHDPLDVNECIHRIRDLLAQHPSDPKHLPPRDCLVLLERRYDWEEPQPIWQHVIFMEHDDSGHSEGDGPWWRIPESTETIDPSRVITWRELPEVE